MSKYRQVRSMVLRRNSFRMFRVKTRMKRLGLITMAFVMLIGVVVTPDFAKELFRDSSVVHAAITSSVDSITPNVGGVNGGTNVVIVGLFGDTNNDWGAVLIGGTTCDIKSWSNTRIDCTTTAKTAGMYDVVVRPTTDNGSAVTVTNGFSYVPMAGGGSTSLTLSAPDSVNINIAPSTTVTIAAAQVDVSVNTNSGGYQLYIDCFLDDGAMTNSTNTGWLTPPRISYDAPTLSIDIENPVILNNGQWGFAIDGSDGSGGNHIPNGFDAHYSVPTPDENSMWSSMACDNNSHPVGWTPATLIKESSLTSDVTPVYFAAKADQSQLPGMYSRDVVFTAVANLAPSQYPHIESLLYDHGPIQGGTAVIINGTGLDSAQTLFIGSSPCANLAIISSTQVTCNAPASTVTGWQGAGIITAGGYDSYLSAYYYTDDEMFSFRIESSDHDCVVPTRKTKNVGEGIYYSWDIDWGDGNVEVYSGMSTDTELPRHDYATYNGAPPTNTEVIIRPHEPVVQGWLDAFGNNSSSPIDEYDLAKIKEITSPFTTLSRTVRPGAFQSTFMSMGIQTINSSLFSNFNTSHSTNFSNMFDSTFKNLQNVNTIPLGLFSGIDTANGTNFSSMFLQSFATWSSMSSTIPPGLFDSINTNSAVNYSRMFESTFALWSNTGASIPPGLFGSIKVNNVVASNLLTMFGGTFGKFRGTGDIGNIFAGADLSGINATNVGVAMFQTFNGMVGLSGSGNAFINSLGLAGISLPVPPVTFLGCTGLSDYNSLPTGWK